MKPRNEIEWGGWVLGKADKVIVDGFDCGDPALNNYFLNRREAFREELLTQTYAFFEATDPFPLAVALVDFCNDVILKHDLPRFARNGIHHNKRGFPAFPAVKITRLGVRREFQHQKVGHRLLEAVQHFFLADNRTGCRFITVDAYRPVVPFYQKHGFERLITEEDDDGAVPTVPMFFDLKPLVVDVLS